MQRLWVLEMFRSGPYKHLATEPARAERQADEATTVAESRATHAEHRSAYGVPPACRTPVLRMQDQPQLTRLMRIHHVVGRHLRRSKRTTIADKSAHAVPDLMR